MMDLISREDVIKLIYKKIETTSDFLQHDALIDLEVGVEDLPTIDAVHVVRCKDCKHYNKKIGWCDYHSHFIDSDGDACHPWESSDWKIFTDDDFCSDGERGRWYGMSETRLLSCPFCGGEIKLDEDDFYMFYCDTCGAGITFAKELESGGVEDCDKKESIERWNTRIPMQNIVERLEELKDKAVKKVKPKNVLEHIDFVEGVDKAIEIIKEEGGL